MSVKQKFIVDIITDEFGDSVDFTPVVNGSIETIRYTKNDFDDGVDFIITLEDTGIEVWNEENVDVSTTKSPRHKIHDEEGEVSMYNASMQEVKDSISVATERIKIITAEGGNKKSGKITIILD